jgi:hypothetical protein
MKRWMIAATSAAAMFVLGCTTQGSSAGSTAALAPAHAAAKAEFTGCLTAANEESASRFPEKPAMRGPGGDEAVTIAGTDGGLVVSHALNHACCLKGTVTTSVEGKVIQVKELLSGIACRCMCSSTITTRVNAPPGDYTVVVSVAREGEAPKEASRQPFTVKKP